MNNVFFFFFCGQVPGRNKQSDGLHTYKYSRQYLWLWLWKVLARMPRQHQLLTAAASTLSAVASSSTRCGGGMG